MKKNWLLMLGLLVVVLSVGVYGFVTGVSNQLWQASMRTIIESTHQGANALNVQFERDFEDLEQIWRQLAQAEPEAREEMLRYYQAVDPDLRFYQAKRQQGGDKKATGYLSALREEQLAGLVPSHINSLTGENVFNMFVQGRLADGNLAYLVKEYRTREIANQFTLSFYDQTGFSYLVDQRGNIMVRSEHRNSNKTVYNLFDMVAGPENDPQVLAQFEQSVQQLKTGWARFSYNGTGLVFCYEPLQLDAGWLLVSVVPERMISAQTNSILQKTLIFSGLLLALMLLIVAVFYAIKMHENTLHTNELQQALNEADRANKAKGRFLMDMSHDIRTPLNAIIGMTAVARQNVNNPDKMQDCLRKIEISGLQLISMVSDVLDMSQIEQGTLVLRQEPCNLDKLFAETLELMQPKAQEAGLQLEAEPLQLANPQGVGDALRIRQVLLNIIDNAVKYTPAGGRVHLTLTQPEPPQDDQVIYHFCCQDTGIGMDEDFQQRMFMPFERARNTTDSKIAGTGVGLPISKSLLEVMGGHIEVDSQPGCGTTIQLAFPLLLAQDEAAPAEMATYADKRVLLVEDNELNMEIMEELLGLFEVQIAKAEDGQQAVDLVQANPGGYFDLVLMDIQMPVLDGYQATQQIRALPHADAQTLPIYAVSANALAEDVQNSLASGMNGHIAKPVDLDELEKVLRKCLG